MDPYAVNRIWLIVGKSGSGKSWLSRWIVAEYCRQELKPYVVVIDTNRDSFDRLYGGLGFVFVPYGRERAGRRYRWDAVIRDRRRIFIEVAGLTGPEIRDFIDAVSAAVMAVGDALLVVDEAHTFFPHNRGSIEFERVLRGGRKFGVDVLMVTQRVVDLGLVAIGQANMLLAFQLTERNERDRVADYIRDGERILPDLSPERHEFVCADLRRGRQSRESTLDFQGVD